RVDALREGTRIALRAQVVEGAPGPDTVSVGVELHEPVDVAAFQAFCVERGVWIRPFGRLVYLMPPYIIDPKDLTALTSAVLAYSSASTAW
ncbi:MAG: hypothetical protein QGG69_04565, partial [Kiritimatiellia bacterium]|nr:hypothetical protein [Kiritimatiellia bacterium]